MTITDTATSSNQVTLIVVAIISGIIGPTVLAILAYLINKANRKADRDERIQIAVAAATATGVLKDRIAVVHTLVNSSLTSAIQSELDATVRELALMREVIALKQAAGHSPTRETLALLDSTVAKIAELKLKLADRSHAEGTSGSTP